MGDNSTCIDVCGVLFGNGTSCLVTVTNFQDCGLGNEKQVVSILPAEGYGSISGKFILGFNGESVELSVFATSNDIQVALGDFEGVGEVSVEPLVGGEYVEYTAQNSTKGGGGVHEINFGVEFVRGDGTKPRNWGEMPLLTVNAENLNGATPLVDVSRICDFVMESSNEGYVWDEQTITITADEGAALGDMRGKISFGLDTTKKPFNETVYTVGFGWGEEVNVETEVVAEGVGGGWWLSDKLVGIFDEEGLGLTGVVSADVEGFLYRNDGNSNSLSWVVRWYTTSGGELLQVTIDGQLPLLLVNTTGLVGGIVEVNHTKLGSCPADDMPMNELEAASTALVAALEAAQAAAEVAAAAAPQIFIEPVVYVCGDGVRGTVEICDDGNSVAGDGCGGDCRVEYGWECSSIVGQRR